MEAALVLDREHAIRAYHWLHDSGRLARYAEGLAWYDGPVVRVGDIQEVSGEINICRNGLHGSMRAIDSLQYVPGGVLQITRHWGAVAKDGDKLASQYRETMAIVPAETALRALVEWACWCVQDCWAILRKHGTEPDTRSIAAVDTVLRFMAGTASRAELDAAAYAAARAAARAAADAAARAAAYAAARAAARAAVDARAAARAAADAAADAAVGARAADAAVRDRQNAELERRLLALAGIAA